MADGCRVLPHGCCRQKDSSSSMRHPATQQLPLLFASCIPSCSPCRRLNRHAHGALTPSGATAGLKARCPATCTRDRCEFNCVRDSSARRRLSLHLEQHHVHGVALGTSITLKTQSTQRSGQRLTRALTQCQGRSAKQPQQPKYRPPVKLIAFKRCQSVRSHLCLPLANCGSRACTSHSKAPNATTTNQKGKYRSPRQRSSACRLKL